MSLGSADASSAYLMKCGRVRFACNGCKVSPRCSSAAADPGIGWGVRPPGRGGTFALPNDSSNRNVQEAHVGQNWIGGCGPWIGPALAAPCFSLGSLRS